MSFAQYNFPDAYRGDNYGPILLKVKDSQGNYLDLSSNKVDVRVRRKDNYAVVLSWSTERQNISFPDSESILLEEISGCLMQMPQGSYMYDLQVSDNLGKTRTYMRGEVYVIHDVTELFYKCCYFLGGSATFTPENYCEFNGGIATFNSPLGYCDFNGGSAVYDIENYCKINGGYAKIFSGTIPPCIPTCPPLN